MQINIINFYKLTHACLFCAETFVEFIRLIFVLNLLDFFITASISYANYLWFIITNPFAEDNYFYLLMALSLMVWGLEMLFPWRKNQAFIRKGFYLDTFFIFFNFFLFNLVFFIAFSNLSELYFHKLLHSLGIPRVKSNL